MNFGELLEEASCARVVAAVDIPFNMPAGAIAHPRLAQPASAAVVAKSIFASSPGLSLALQTSMQEAARGELANARGEQPQQLQPRTQNNNNNSIHSNREEEYESRSGSDNMEGGSGDDLDADHPPRKKRYHRHTPQQIQELESLFKECPHPDEKQRAELSKRLCLESRQVKFWFQNRRTQMKTQLERHENAILRSENDKLRAENMAMRDAMRSPMCGGCGGPAVLGEASMEAQHLRLENARLKDEFDRVCALAEKFLGRASAAAAAAAAAFPSLPLVSPPMVGLERSIERSMLLELALAAMDELLKLAQTDDPIWLPGLDGGHGDKETINYEEYLKVFPRCVGPKPVGYVTETSRETAMVIINSHALVETLVDASRWVEMFPCMIARASTTDVISAGMGGTRNGALQLMTAELQVLSPLVPVREVSFLRFCKQHAEGVWAVVDVSVDAVRDGPGGPVYAACRRLPSGCVVQDMPNGYSKVTWVEHAEYDEGEVHQLFQPMVAAGMAFGAQRWVATLQRQCQCLAVLMSSSLPSRDSFGMTGAGRRSMLTLALRMTDNFCAGVCGSSIHAWDKICGGGAGDDVRVMRRKSVDNPGEPPGVVLSVATSVWLPTTPQRLFAFLRDEQLRSEWDILSNGGPMQEVAHIAKGPDPANCVSLLRSSATDADQGSMLILQETCMDASSALVVYAPVDILAMHVVMNGGDSTCVALLPSGFAIVPDGPVTIHPPSAAIVDPTSPPGASTGGSLLTVAFQVLVNSQPMAKLTVESVDTVSNLISCTVQKIKAALHCEN